MREIQENDSRRYFTAEELDDKDIIPRIQKLDAFFATTRKYVMGQNGVGQSKTAMNNREMDPEVKLNSYTKHPMTYLRALESNKSKSLQMKMIKMGQNNSPNRGSINTE